MLILLFPQVRKNPCIQQASLHTGTKVFIHKAVHAAFSFAPCLGEENIKKPLELPATQQREGWGNCELCGSQNVRVMLN